jgi:hypothetical protein
MGLGVGIQKRERSGYDWNHVDAIAQGLMGPQKQQKNHELTEGGSRST